MVDYSVDLLTLTGTFHQESADHQVRAWRGHSSQYSAPDLWPFHTQSPISDPNRTPVPNPNPFPQLPAAVGEREGDEDWETSQYPVVTNPFPELSFNDLDGVGVELSQSQPQQNLAGGNQANDTIWADLQYNSGLSVSRVGGESNGNPWSLFPLDFQPSEGTELPELPEEVALSESEANTALAPAWPGWGEGTDHQLHVTGPDVFQQLRVENSPLQHSLQLELLGPGIQIEDLNCPRLLNNPSSQQLHRNFQGRTWLNTSQSASITQTTLNTSHVLSTSRFPAESTSVLDLGLSNNTSNIPPPCIDSRHRILGGAATSLTTRLSPQSQTPAQSQSPVRSQPVPSTLTATTTINQTSTMPPASRSKQPAVASASKSANKRSHFSNNPSDARSQKRFKQEDEDDGAFSLGFSQETNHEIIDLVDEEDIPESVRKEIEQKEQKLTRLAGFQCVICMDDCSNLVVTSCEHHSPDTSSKEPGQIPATNYEAWEVRMRKEITKAALTLRNLAVQPITLLLILVVTSRLGTIERPDLATRTLT
ncbi:hypothetical protein MKZ38_009500 [Zalerion maritima]|uniref:Uncharacterized protein n=1 Tax=Zalerion maritima TaxID=339359 RepID=A0AAD5RTC6_9PEZI|nr:hypothetical protein MKZ38_009500 [Zalerion maritima]